jgi:hypothetical protein
MSQFLLLLFAFLAVALLYRWRDAIIARLKAFDARNAARREEELRARYDANAHYRHTLRLAEEEFEEVREFRARDPRTGVDLPRYVFLGEEYATREEAEAARRAAIIDKARAFYVEMDTIMLRRGAQHERTPDAKPLPSPKKANGSSE